MRDVNSKAAAAALNVRAGSLSEPAGFDGLAHLCEHMLFQGTEKYPDESYYAKYISSNGGSRNAMTSEEDTMYYFEVRNDALEGALEIFCEFFKAPLFLDAALDREINMVESEFRKNVSSSEKSIYQFIKSEISDEKSPLNRFSTGSKESLTKENIRDHITEFYRKNYSSNLM